MKKTTSDYTEWAQKAYDKLKNKKEPKFRSKLEEKVATLLKELGISYEYESTQVPYTIQHNYTPDLCSQTMSIWKQRDTGTQQTEGKCWLLNETIQT